MKSNQQTIDKVKRQLTDALAGVDGYLNNWSASPQDFTTEAELQTFAAKLREMRASLDAGVSVAILGLWRIMETWPYNDQVRKKIVEAELSYERLK